MTDPIEAAARAAEAAGNTADSRGDDNPSYWDSIARAALTAAAQAAAPEVFTVAESLREAARHLQNVGTEGADIPWTLRRAADMLESFASREPTPTMIGAGAYKFAELLADHDFLPDQEGARLIWEAMEKARCSPV